MEPITRKKSTNYAFQLKIVRIVILIIIFKKSINMIFGLKRTSNYNSCYINAAIQILVHTEPLFKFIGTLKYN